MAGPWTLLVGAVVIGLIGVWIYRRAPALDADFKRRFNNENAFGHKFIGGFLVAVGIVGVVVGVFGLISN